MNYASVCRRIGELVGLVAVAQLVPLAWSVHLRSPDVRAFAISIAIGVAIALALRLPFSRPRDLGRREALIVVVAGWLAAGTVGAIPFILSDAIPGWIDAVFETVSGLTTTGATVLANVDDQPPGIFMWRATLQWLGGMGIAVLFTAVFPALGIGGTRLLAAEMPGPVVEKLTPRVRETAGLLWVVYSALTALQFVLLVAAGLPAYDALLHSLATLGTGGFSNQSLSVQSYGSLWVERITAVFMFLGGVNLALQYRVLWLREWHRLRSSELRGYGLIITLAAALIAFNLWTAGVYGRFGEALHHGIFQVISLVTTTGYVSADYDAWPTASRAILFLLLFCGGMAGSTAGGIKVIRLVVLAKHALQSVTMLHHPHATVPLLVDNKPVSVPVLRSIVQFFILYIGLFGASFIILSFEGYDLVTTLSAAIAALGNTGTAFGLVGPYESYAFFSPWAKVYLTMLMIAGRLEVIAVMVLFTRAFWRR